MPHHPKPFFRSGRGWYVQIGKQQIKLAAGPENPQTEAAAWERYHVLMAEQSNPSLPTLPQSSADSGLIVAEVLDKYLTWCGNHRSTRTHGWYRDHLQSFLNHLGGNARLAADALRPFHVVEWADAQADWSPTTRRGAIIAVQRAYNWAEEIGHLTANPIRKIKKPQARRRESLITPEEFQDILGRYPAGDTFRDLLEFAWETGVRPQEACRVEARHVSLPRHLAAFPPAEAKGKKRWRVIHMTARAEEIIARLIAAYPEGPLFRNEDGTPWNRYSVHCRFSRLKERLGMEALRQAGIPIPPLPRFDRRRFKDRAVMLAAKKEHQKKILERQKKIAAEARKLGKGFCLYGARHGFATRKLEGGLDHITVAALLGHADATMLSRVYSHLGDHHDYLHEQLNKTAGQ